MAEPAVLPVRVGRGKHFACTFIFEEVDLTGAVLRAQVRHYPDAPGTPLAEFGTVTKDGAEGFQLIRVTGFGKTLESHVAFVISKATNERMPAPAERGGDLILAWGCSVAAAGDEEEDFLKGPWIVEARANR